MAELTSMGFRPGGSIPHRLDARCKLASLAMLSIVTLRADAWGLSVLTLLLASAIGHTGISFRSMAKEMRFFGLLLLMVFLARTLSTPGTPLISVAGVSATREGALAGAIVCWRLACVVAASAVFIAATRPSEIRGAVIWLLAPVPGIPERRVGTMISLLVRFIPMILHQARETAEAQRARCIERRRNPVVRLTILATALLRRIFEDADRLVVAMEARCYHEDRTGPVFKTTRLDWAVVSATALLCAGITLLSYASGRFY